MRFPWFSSSTRVHPKPFVQAPFIGRDSLMTALATCLHTATAGSVQCGLLTGAPGSGKTALVDEFVLTHCTQPRVLLLRLNAAAYLLEQDVYQELFLALRERSEQILRLVYNDTKGVRKHLGLNWDEKEFAQMLASTDWAPIQAEIHQQPKRSSPLAALFLSVQQFPWAVGAAMVLDTMARGTGGIQSSRPWTQRWKEVLHTLCVRAYAAETVLVLAIDQLPAGTSKVTAAQQLWTTAWQNFVTVTLEEERARLFLLWVGTPEGLQPVQAALGERASVTRLHVDPLSAGEWQQLQRHVGRRLPRRAQAAWQQYTQTHQTASQPDTLCLTAAWVAMHSEAGQATEVANPVPLTQDALLAHFVDGIAQRHPTLRALWSQVLDAWAFLPPETHFVVEELLPRCDLAALQLDPVAGRTGIETLLATAVRYGLLRYDTYVARYTTGPGYLQEGLQRTIVADEEERVRTAQRWQSMTVILSHIRRGERARLEALAAENLEANNVVEQEALGSLLGAVFRRLLPACDKAERQRMALALGGFSSPLAVDLLLTLLQDEEGQVRSGAVQSLADLHHAVTLPALLEALRDVNSDVRWIATQALGRLPAAAAVDALIPMLADEDREVGRIAAQGLGSQGDRRAVPHLIAAMRESYPLLRESAALALGQLADKRAIPALQSLLEDANQQVRRSAETALERLAASAI